MRARRSKYGAVRTAIDGITFASKKEARRYSELRLLEKAGEIRQLTLQPALVIAAPTGWNEETKTFAAWKQVAIYRADFEYIEAATGEIVTEDVKSQATRTPVYKLKKALVEAQYGITIREV